MSSLSLQKSMKDSAEELQDYLRDLKLWEKDIKEEDRKLMEKRNNSSSDTQKKTIPPIRSNKKQGTSSTMNEQSQPKKSNPPTKRISSYDYEAWDKYDPDKETNSDSDDGIEETKSNTNTAERKASPPKLENGKIKVKQNTESQKKANQDTSKDLPKSVSSPTQKERAEKLKEEGNTLYAKGKLSDAVAKYTQGIGLDPSNPLLPANRAMAYIKLKKFKAAEKDCSKALKLNPNYIKGYLRRAAARTNLSRISEAIEDYEKVLELEPWNKDAKKELEKLKENLNLKILTSEDSIENNDKMNKKLKTEETESTQINVKTPTFNQSTEKPLHMQSTKPLLDVPVIDVNSREEMDQMLGRVTVSQPVKSSIPEIKSSPTPSTSQKKQPLKPSVPDPPRTSHQFSQDWRKVVKFEDLAAAYLKSIPNGFFHGTEVEVDQLVEVVETLCSGTLEANAAATIMSSLMKSRGFFLNIAFLETHQTKVFQNFMSKVEKCETFQEELKQLKDVL